MRYQRAELPLKLDGLAVARQFFAGCFAEYDLARETLWVAHVDDQARCLHVSCHEGDDTGMHFPLKPIIADAAQYHSAGIILAHNHPSGVAEPSDADQMITRRLKDALGLVDIRLLDHLVVGDGSCVSFAERGLL